MAPYINMTMKLYLRPCTAYVLYAFKMISFGCERQWRVTILAI